MTSCVHQGVFSKLALQKTMQSQFARALASGSDQGIGVGRTQVDPGGSHEAVLRAVLGLPLFVFFAKRTLTNLVN